MRIMLPLALFALLAGCAHRPRDLAGCDLPIERLVLPEPEGGALEGTARTAPSVMAEAMRAALTPGTSESLAPTRPAALFLSGGGQNGAFGAGFLDQWQRRGGLPAFRVVTGVSTGALLGTMAFVGRPERAVAGYTIASEADLIDVQARGAIDAARKGAFATLGPLRARIDRLLDTAAGQDDDALLGKMARRGDTGARFLVGVVDAREGEAYEVDMTALAQRWAAPGARRAAVKACFIEALIASSSVPLAAPPVYIDGHMFIDGGARFAVFRAIEQSALAAARADAPPGAGPIGFTILNARWEIAPECRFRSEKGQPCPATGTLRDWDLLSLAQRSAAILTNQVQRFSVLEVQAGGPDDRFDRIRADADDFVLDGRTCRDWRTVDEAAKPAPLQFRPNEMRCLIAYGRARADRLHWWDVR